MATKRKNDSAETAADKSESKNPKRSQTFRDDYTKKWSFITTGKKGNTFAYCEVCACDFSIKSGGKDDCRRHVDTDKHEKNSKKLKEQQNNSKITGFFPGTAPATASSLQMDTTRAEVMMVDLITELNLPFSALDVFNKALPIMFKDSKIASQFQCGRSKGTAVVREIAAKTSLTLAERLKQRPFTLSTDGSNDSGDKKLFPLVVRTVDPDTLEVRSDVLAVPAVEGSATGKVFF